MATKHCLTCKYRHPQPTYSGDKYACTKFGVNVKKEQECKHPEILENEPKVDNWNDKMRVMNIVIGKLEKSVAEMR